MSAQVIVLCLKRIHTYAFGDAAFNDIYDMSTTHRMQSPAYHACWSGKVCNEEVTYMHIMETRANFIKLAMVRHILVNLDFTL